MNIDFRLNESINKIEERIYRSVIYQSKKELYMIKNPTKSCFKLLMKKIAKLITLS